MATSDCSEFRDEILGHFLQGKPLSSQAREHYHECVDCIAAVTMELNRNAANMVRTRGARVNATILPESTRQALAHGRQVLEREFGIPAGNKAIGSANVNIDASNITYENHDVMFERSEEPAVALTEGNGEADLGFLFELHDASSRVLAQPTGAVRTRGPMFEVFTSSAVWMILGATVWEVAPKILGYFAGLFWRDFVTGKEEISAEDVAEQNKEMMAQNNEMMERMMANFEWIGKKCRHFEKTNETLLADLCEMKMQLRHLPEATEQRIVSRLVKQGWSEAKAVRGVRAVSEAARQ